MNAIDPFVETSGSLESYSGWQRVSCQVVLKKGDCFSAHERFPALPYKDSAIRSTIQ
jgi:hypothetical protein